MKHSPKLVSLALLFVTAAAAVGPVREATAELRIRDICRVKGQEETTLHGLGLVVGLNGTGDGDLPATRALAQMMELMGNPVSRTAAGEPLLEELKNAQNVAMVFVTATVPAQGARQGDSLNLHVNAISATSLEGGYLMLTPLLGPHPGDNHIYGFAQGLLDVETGGPPTAARIHNGCRLGADFDNAFVLDGKITLILDEYHASFQTAYDIEALLNDPQTFGVFTGEDSFTSSAYDDPSATRQQIARALDQVNIEVTIPETYRANAVQFVAEVLDTRLLNRGGEARVVINERSGVIVIGENVEIGPVAVTHKSLSIQTGDRASDGPLHLLDPSSQTSTTKLQALVDALNALKVDTQDIIDIIKELERSGDLFGHLVVQ
jgi:flagellar P-ring protein precursor FlgI